MQKRTSVSTLLLLISLSLIGTLGASAQQRKKPQKEEVKYTNDYRGTSLGVEVGGGISRLLGSDPFSTEVQLYSDFGNRYFPTLELGYAKSNEAGDNTHIQFHSSGAYGKAGLDYNILYKKPYLPGQLFIGGRVGFTSFKYDVSGPNMTDPNYGGTITLPFERKGISASAVWIEIVAGLRTRVYKNFSMGWTLRYKQRVKDGGDANISPWYTPGLGHYSESKFQFTYSLIYKLPF